MNVNECRRIKRHISRAGCTRTRFDFINNGNWIIRAEPDDKVLSARMKNIARRHRDDASAQGEGEGGRKKIRKANAQC